MASGSPFQTVSVAEKKLHAAVLVRDLCSLSISKSMAWHIWLQCGVQMAWLIEPVYCVAQGSDFECNVTYDEKPMKIRQKIDSVLLTYSYVAHDSSKLVLDLLQHIAESLWLSSMNY